MLAALRRQMAAGEASAESLFSVVRLIAESMVADVCSVYARAEDDGFVLVATHGLRMEAVRQTRLKPGEGLVGLVAETLEPVAESNAPRHVRFSYRPETGEDPYKSFLGVPILRQGRCVGVLVVQNSTEMRHAGEEVEVLETIAMLVAQILAASPGLIAGLSVIDRRPVSLKAACINSGLCIGRAALQDPVVPSAQYFSANPAAEQERLSEALARLRGWIEDVLNRGALLQAGASREVFESYSLLASDPSWERRLGEALQAGLSAEAAIDRVRGQHRARLGAVRDAYLREKLHDLEDLENRLLRFLKDGSGDAATVKPGSLKGAVLVARSIGPAELLDYAQGGIAGLLLEQGGIGGHVAIIARALDVPALVCGDGLTATIQPDDELVLDAETGEVHIRPPRAVIDATAARIELASQQKAVVAKARAAPARSRDGKLVTVLMNAGLDMEVDHLDQSGAEGIGLFRTEFQFMMSAQLPRLSAQQAFYRGVLDKAGDRTVVFRTIDIGGDKLANGIKNTKEANPALGVRSLRLALKQPGMFKTQLRALIRAAGGRSLSLLIPFVSTASEMQQTRQMIGAEMDWARQQGHAVPRELSVGAMIEVPSAAFAVREIARYCDFLSIGTNDLLQHFFAADRDNSEVSRRYGLLEPAALRLLHMIEREAAAARLPISVCGESAGQPLEAIALLALGYRRLSMAAPRIGPIKALVRGLDISKVRRKLLSELNAEKPDPKAALLRVCGESVLI